MTSRRVLLLSGYWLAYKLRFKFESGGETPRPDARRVPQPSVGARTDKATGALPDSVSLDDTTAACERLLRLHGVIG